MLALRLTANDRGICSWRTGDIYLTWYGMSNVASLIFFLCILSMMTEQVQDHQHTLHITKPEPSTNFNQLIEFNIYQDHTSFSWLQFIYFWILMFIPTSCKYKTSFVVLVASVSLRKYGISTWRTKHACVRQKFIKRKHHCNLEVTYLQENYWATHHVSVA